MTKEEQILNKLLESELDIVINIDHGIDGLVFKCNNCYFSLEITHWFPRGIMGHTLCIIDRVPNPDLSKYVYYVSVLLHSYDWEDGIKFNHELTEKFDKLRDKLFKLRDEKHKNSREKRLDKILKEIGV